MPKRSTGCHRCRARKIKCDEEKPACKRCRRVGIECPGYRPDLHVGARFVVHTVNQQAALSARWDVLNLPHARFPGCPPAYITPPPSTPDDCSGSSDGHGVTGMTPDTPANGFPRNESALDDAKALQSTSGASQWAAEECRQDDSDDRPLIVITRPDRMSQRHAMRLGMMGAFLEVRYPTAEDKRAAKSSYIAALPGLDLSMPLLQAAIDTICFAGLGSAHRHVNWIHESRDRYGKALSMLSREVSRPPARDERRISVVASMMLMCLAEQLDVISLPGVGASGWISHLTGVQQYLKACGPSIIKSPFDFLLFHNLRLSSLFLGIAQRKAVLLADPEWLELTQARRPDGSLALRDFSNLGMRLPALLEWTDRLLNATARTATWRCELEILCQNIVQLKQEFEYWYLLVQIIGPTHDIMNLHNIDECANTTFHSAFHFKTPRALRQDTFYWIFLQILVCTALRLMYFLPKNLVSWPWDFKEIEREAYVLSTNLCRSVPYCATAGIPEFKELAKWFLDCAQNYFEDADDCDDELTWCHEARCTIALQPRDSNSDTKHSANKLWNLGRIAPYVMTPARYKAPDLRFGALSQPPKVGGPGSVDLALNVHNSATFAADLRTELAGSDADATWVLYE